MSLACLVSSPSARAGPSEEGAAKPAASEPTPTAAELERWVAQLGDDLYATRETAQRRLENAGQAALPVVGRAAQKGDLETSTRAVNILLKWSSDASNDWRLRSLEALMQLKNRPAESALAAKILGRVREEVAILRLLEEGAKIRRDRSVLIVRGRQIPLQVVIGPEWKGDVEALESIEDFRAITTLSFYSAPFDQKSFEKQVLPLLKDAKQIHVLQIYGTPISDKAIAKLKAELPMVGTIDVRNSARLGVRGSLDPQEGRITEVEPGSAADRAGLKGGDTITHVDGVKVRNFKHLTELIAAHQGGDTATLTVARGRIELPQPIEPAVEEVVVTFDRWGEVESGEDLTIEQLRQRTHTGPTSISRRR